MLGIIKKLFLNRKISLLDFECQTALPLLTSVPKSYHLYTFYNVARNCEHVKLTVLFA
jgi:hypothetical protein